MVSVIVPCFNSEKYLRRAIESVLAQTVPVTEILIYDDASTDSSYNIMQALSSSSERVKIFRGFENVGAGLARAFLLKKCVGDVIAFLDSDDYWLPHKLEQQLKWFNDPEIGIVTGFQRIFDESRGDLGVRKISIPVNRYSMLITNWLSTSMTVLRADLLNAKIMPPARARQDYAYWLKIFWENRCIKCHVVGNEVGVYLRRKGSVSSSAIKNVGYNYRMLRTDMGFSVGSSIVLVAIHIVIRVLRT
jgi:teichuronic acid biosynthesis glycosyltransferase TuaG